MTHIAAGHSKQSMSQIRPRKEYLIPSDNMTVLA